MSCKRANVTPASTSSLRQIGGREPRRVTLSRYVFEFAADVAESRVDIMNVPFAVWHSEA
jgi:hypothetical protein